MTKKIINDQPNPNKGANGTNQLCSTCTDSQGKIKSAYESVNRAKSAASFILKKEGVEVHIYECPHHQGWHLTKSLN